jgi:4-diphosphocytidyl-2-C-methyl-D-erythritol kinase
MHPIASWFHAIDLADRVTVTRVAPERSRLEIQWADDAPRPGRLDWRVTDDLARRAVDLVLETARREHDAGPVGAHVAIDKRIPLGAGLGGGSSDAGAAMLAINAQLDAPLSHETLVELSTHIGSDVAYFLSRPDRPESEPPPPALVRNLGDDITPLAPVGGTLVLLIPDFACSTGAVYRAFDEAHRSTIHALREEDVRALIRAPLESARLFNDLTLAAERAEPRLAELRAVLLATLGSSRPVHVTGSGSAMFVLCDEGEAPELTARIESAAPNVRAVPTRLV